jgi:hypothetical protein
VIGEGSKKIELHSSQKFVSILHFFFASNRHDSFKLSLYNNEMGGLRERLPAMCKAVEVDVEVCAETVH